MEKRVCFPCSKAEALALLYLQKTDTSKMTPKEFHEQYENLLLEFKQLSSKGSTSVF